MVFAPFSRAVALLHCPARLALAHLPPGSAAGQAWSPALYCVSPLACPALRRNCLQESRARGSATSGVFACLRSALLSAVLPFGQKPAHLVCVALFLNPPETRKVVGNASFPSFSRSVSTDYRLLSLRAKRFVLADKDFVLDSNPALAGGMRTDKLFSLHSFITVT